MAVERIINSHQAYAKLIEGYEGSKEKCDNNKVINIENKMKNSFKTYYITKQVNNNDYYSDTTTIITFNDGRKDCVGYINNPYFNYSFGNDYEIWIATEKLDIAKKDFINREVYKIEVDMDHMTIENKSIVAFDELTEDKGIQRKRSSN